MTDKLILKGFELASDFLSYLREGGERDERMHMASLERQKEFDLRMLASLAEVSQKLDQVAQDVVDKVTLKIESDRYEKLAVMIKSVKFALEFDNANMLSQALVNLFEDAEYAKCRLAEGKLTWLGPWILAESVRIVALRKIAADEKAMAAIHRAAFDFRIDILNFTAHFIIQKNKSPWLKISEFVDGKNEDILALIQNADGFLIGEEKLTVVNVGDIDSTEDSEVVGIQVKVGDKVAKGQHLITVESNKSVIEIPSSHGGVVKQIKVKVGDLVSPGDVILYLG